VLELLASPGTEEPGPPDTRRDPVEGTTSECHIHPRAISPSLLLELGRRPSSGVAWSRGRRLALDLAEPEEPMLAFNDHRLARLRDYAARHSVRKATLSDGMVLLGARGFVKSFRATGGNAQSGEPIRR
jgi:hypothetical protein